MSAQQLELRPGVSLDSPPGSSPAPILATGIPVAMKCAFCGEVTAAWILVRVNGARKPICHACWEASH